MRGANTSRWISEAPERPMFRELEWGSTKAPVRSALLKAHHIVLTRSYGESAWLTFAIEDLEPRLGQQCC